MNLRPEFFFVLVLGIATGGPLWSQAPGDRPPQPRPALLALDTDQDKTLSAAEIAAASASLAKLDADGDGSLSSIEFLPRQVDPAAADPEALVARLMVLDRNNDGALTTDEMPERLQGLMARADGNHDGRLTAEEIRAYAKTQAGPAGRPQYGAQVTRMDPILDVLDADHDGVLSPAELASATRALKTLDLNGDGQLTPDEIKVKQLTAAERATHTMDEWDTNKDGKLSKAEAPDRMQEQFGKIDANQDGVVDAQELTAWFATMPAQRPRPAETPNHP